MKKSASLLLMVVTSLVIHAEKVEEPLRLGIVNFEKAVSQEILAQKEIKDLEKEAQESKARMQKTGAEFEKKYAEFQKSMATMNDKARADKQAALGAEYNALQEQLQKSNIDLERKQQDLLMKLENQNQFILDALATRKKLDIVLNSKGVAYISDRVKANDLTQELVADYNKTHPAPQEGAKKSNTKANDKGKTKKK